MRIALLSVSAAMFVHGIREISSFLKSKGHDTEIFFILSKKYNKDVLIQLSNRLKKFDFIGVSCTSISSNLTKCILKTIKEETKVPIIWGGIHATLNPEECLKYCDFVCIGEGEHSFLELIQKVQKGQNTDSILNIVTKNNIDNKTRGLIQNLDELPFPDYDVSSHWIVDNQGIRRYESKDLYNTYENFFRLSEISGDLSRLFYAHTVRGCPYSCLFCCNSYIRSLYPSENFIRKRSIKKVIAELEKMKKEFEYDSLWFTDDSFFIRSLSEIEEFSLLYKEKINVPFICYADPRNIQEDKLLFLLEAGLIRIDMGIETGSEKINREIYGRNISNQKILEAACLLNKYQLRMDCPEYQIIFSNPYETEEDIMSTLSLIDRIPKPFFLQTFPLVFFPGSKLYSKAVKDNLIKSKKEAAFDVDYVEYSKNLISRYSLFKGTFVLNYVERLLCGLVTENKYGKLPKRLFNFLVKRRKILNYFSFVLLLILALFVFVEEFVKLGKINKNIEKIKRRDKWNK